MRVLGEVTALMHCLEGHNLFENIVTRLRKPCGVPPFVQRQAADEIERLRAEVERLTQWRDELIPKYAKAHEEAKISSRALTTAIDDIAKRDALLATWERCLPVSDEYRVENSPIGSVQNYISTLEQYIEHLTGSSVEFVDMREALTGEADG